MDVKRQDEFLPSLNVVNTDLKAAEKFSNTTPVKDTVSVILVMIRMSLLLLREYLSQADKYTQDSLTITSTLGWPVILSILPSAGVEVVK